MTKSRAIFLDRDGVLNLAVVRNGKPHPPACVADVKIFDGLRNDLQHLKDAGFLLIVVTNQPDVARGKTSRETVEGINALVARELPAIDRFMVCYHDNEENCDCRKPRPGMLLASAREFNIDLARSYIIGDRWADVEAGIAASCRTIFIDNGYLEKQPTHCDYRVSSTREGLGIIRSEIRHEEG
jgi:D-glycero-D-manno-heptose 1,7-bisphosphate phosphatase